MPSARTSEPSSLATPEVTQPGSCATADVGHESVGDAWYKTRCDWHVRHAFRARRARRLSHRSGPFLPHGAVPARDLVLQGELMRPAPFGAVSCLLRAAAAPLRAQASLASIIAIRRRRVVVRRGCGGRASARCRRVRRQRRASLGAPLDRTARRRPRARDQRARISRRSAPHTRNLGQARAMMIVGVAALIAARSSAIRRARSSWWAAR